jgi:predicted O-methyltransferase YrrM
MLFALLQIAKSEEKVFSEDWFSHNIEIWNNYKKELDGIANKKCLEIGAYEGRSSIYIVENYCNGNGSSLDAIDTWDSSLNNKEGLLGELNKKFIHNDLYERYNRNLKHYIDQGVVHTYRGKSSDKLIEFVKEVKDGRREKYDFIYVDASHSAKDVLVDAVLSWELLKNGGIMIFDDYKWEMFKEKKYLHPALAIDSFLSSYESMYVLLNKGYQVHIKKLREEPIS